MRFEETLNNSVANFPEFGVRYSRLTVPYVTHEEIEDGIARGRRLRAQFYRQAAEAVVVRQILFGARFTARITGTVIETLNRDRELRGTIKALRSLEDWQLSDIGLDRSDIRDIARTLAYAKPSEESTVTAPSEHPEAEAEFTPARAA